MRRRPWRALAAVAAAAVLAGCAATPSRVDPFEPFNRAMYEIHEVVDPNIARPLAQAYVDVVPKFVRGVVSNFFGNIDDLFSAINGFLQGKPDKAGHDLGRVILNTGFGLGGLLDFATDAGIEKGNEDFGQTLAVWGFEPGPYIFVPVFGPTNLRDGIGVVVRLAVGPVGFIPDVPWRNAVYGLGAVDLRAQVLGASEIVDTAALDRYLFIRNAYLQRRRYLIHDGAPPREAEEE